MVSVQEEADFMADETAVLEQGTAELPDAPLGEPVEPEVAETEQQATTETEEVQEETPVSPFAGKDFDEIAKDPEVERVIKDRLAKHEESLRQKGEAERARALHEQETKQYRELRAQAANANAHWASNAIRQAVKKAMDDGNDVESQMFDGVAGWLNTQALVQANETVVSVAQQYLERYHPQAKVPQDLVRAFNSAQANQDIRGMMMSMLAMVDVANRDSVAKNAIEQYEKELAQEKSKEQQVEKERTAATAARSAPKPVGGAAATTRPRELSDILADPSISSAQKREAYHKKYGFYPG